jgi:hypothetical protein
LAQTSYSRVYATTLGNDASCTNDGPHNIICMNDMKEPYGGSERNYN